MDRSTSVRDVDMEYVGSVSTNHSKTSAATLFPPTLLQSQATSPDLHCSESPTLCKEIVHVHHKASEKQQKLDAAWLDTEGASSSMHCPAHAYPDRCGRPVDLRSEQANEDSNKSDRMTHLPAILSAARFMGQQLSIFVQQWRDGVFSCPKWAVIQACLRVTCSNWVWCLVLGTWLEQKTARKWGPAETLLTTAFCGCVFELLGGQATLVVGPSSPSLVFTIATATTARHFGIDAVPWMGWIGVWGSVILVLAALSNVRRCMSHITFFTWGTLCIFIRLSLLWAAVEQIVHMFTDPHLALDSALLSLWLATITFFVVLLLENTQNWGNSIQLNHQAFADYGPIFVLVIFTAIPHLPKFRHTDIPQVGLPKSSYHTDQLSKLGCVTLTVLPFWAILLAIIPGIMFAILLFIYQDTTAGMLKDDASWIPLYRNSKQWDICLIALLVFLCSIFGLPCACGMLYQSQVHVRALTLKLHDYSDIEDRRGVITKVQVQRMSGLGASLLSAAILLPPARHIVTKVPVAILTGLLLKYAFTLYGSWDIIIFIIRFFHAKSCRQSSKSALFVYTTAQICCVLLTFTVSKTAAAVMFPFFILVTLWVRHAAMRRLFRRADFATLDSKLHKYCTDISSSGQLSMPSHDIHAHSQQAWPTISIRQTLKSAIAVPIEDEHTITKRQDPIQMDEVEAAAVGESEESPLPYAISPSFLHASTRRLKERSRRRFKRKRQISIENADAVSPEEHAHIPPLVKAMMEEQEHNCTASCDQDEDMNLSKRISPRLSPKFFRKSKPGQESSLEVHSNLLYEPKRPTRQSHSENRSQEPSSAIADELEENATEMQGGLQRQRALPFHGSPGIGRCVKSPAGPKSPSPMSVWRKKQLSISIAMARRRAFPLKAVHSDSRACNRPRKPLPSLRSASASRWPTIDVDRLHHLQQQRHSTCTSKDAIGCEI